ncbi:hypothetical protein L3Y34_003374 [Caenorhabditis briggsae]|uniref:Uncharacterized protein n=1 Tax=Caenorhabditis briggsae TaxID=6238 RepID=A0AAE9A798_CAEBR|nr:hypothetical protein L3Y34_003374 [Caenorhabditis briggsae]
MEKPGASAQNAPQVQPQEQPMDHDSDIEEFEPVIMTFYAPDTSDEPPEGPPIPPKIERKISVQKHHVAVQVMAPNPDNPIVLDDDEPVILQPEPIAPPAEPAVVAQGQEPNPNPQEPEIVEIELPPERIAEPAPAEPVQAVPEVMPAVAPQAEPAVAEPAQPAVAPPAEPVVVEPELAEPEPAEPGPVEPDEPAVLPELEEEMEQEDVEEPVKVRRSARRRRASTPPGVRGSGRPPRRSCTVSSPKRPARR